MKFLPVDVSSFSTLINGNYIYVDKTQYIYNLFSTGGRYYFFSRPRRFGKTLLISTLKELFSGNKELFKDLWISKSDYEWEQYPVIHLDFSKIGHETVTELKINLIWTLNQIAKENNINLKSAPSITTKFSLLIQELSKINKVVILIDEYDKPILDHIKDVKRAEAQRDLLKNFYSVLKGMDEYLKAVFITGVTKFSKTSIFSGINNLNDISIDQDSAEILGYTEDEIEKYFQDYINKSIPDLNLNKKDYFLKLKDWYNGYRFSKGETKVYNPFSVLYLFKKEEFRNFWFESGTPTFLVELLKKQYNSLENITNIEIKLDSLGTFELDNIPLVPLLFQTGYLTISDYNKETDRFTLDYPNFEVSESLNKLLVATLSNASTIKVDNVLTDIIRALKNNDIDNFCLIINSLFANIPYSLHIAKESYYHSLFQFLLNLLAIESQSEILTNIGRIDAALFINNYIYIFEFKYNVDPSKAIEQIAEKKYYERYLNLKKEIVLVGICFIQKEKQVNVECVTKKL